MTSTYLLQQYVNKYMLLFYLHAQSMKPHVYLCQEGQPDLKRTQLYNNQQRVNCLQTLHLLMTPVMMII